jgi:hypothetical protein
MTGRCRWACAGAGIGIDRDDRFQGNLEIAVYPDDVPRWSSASTDTIAPSALLSLETALLRFNDAVELLTSSSGYRMPKFVKLHPERHYPR